MSSAPVSRRAFLAGSAGAVLGAAAVGAAAAPAPALLSARNKAVSPAVLSSDLYASPDPQRFVFGIYRGARPASFGPADVAFAPPGTKTYTTFSTELLKDGLPKGRGLYVAEAVFPAAGIWTAQAVLPKQAVPFAVQVKERPEAPVVGAAAPAAPSPTPVAPLDVDPICTRVPKCPLHAVSLSEVIGTRPVAVMFATPALCQSQYCGPVLDQLLDVMAPYQQQGVAMVHVEIYTSTRGAKVAPTVEAWGLPSEPWFYTVDASGVIRDRLDGAFATTEVTAALDRLVA
ncbi:MAG: hypothetical protein FJW95_15290 [Actinobacteria bacterium]|nr:hypothetical protein [Actinomycetota bacterium]